MTTTFYDISPPITPELRVFPGDTPMSREVLMDIAKGDSVTVSTLRATVHLGAHADAPSHYAARGRTIDEQTLGLYVGECQVISCDVARGGLVTIECMAQRPRTERVLLRTATFPDPRNWNQDFAAIAPETVDALADLGVRLIGIDTPSVDPATSKTLDSHQRFFARDVAILEGLVLDGVPDDLYELIALPLRLIGFDASPVRAVLRPKGPPA